MATTVADATRGSDRWSSIPEVMRKEIDVFETELRRFQAGEVPEKVFTEFRLRHGAYGQRQERVQMQRIKIPMGMLTLDQLGALADISEEYAVGVLHVTTRQDFQCHFIDINDCPNMFRRLAETGITTKEACGNTVRNVTCCPEAGVCTTELFDVVPHAKAMTYFMLRHPDAQNFGRKFKIAYSGCAEKACGLARMHDLGAVAAIKDGQEGFQVFVGGGLGSLPQQAWEYSSFVPANEMLPLAQAIARVFGRDGEKTNRAKARMKFLIGKIGFDEFKKRVDEERTKLPFDPAWEQQLETALAEYSDQPLKAPSKLETPAGASAEYKKWLELNVRPQKQDGYSMVEVFLPLGDISSDQMSGLAGVLKKYIQSTIRATVSQNLLLRWITNEDLPALHEDLKALQIAETGAGKLKDITACPGTDSCKLGISSSRGLAGVMHEKFSNGMSDLADRDDLKVKLSGCFNSCGQHHIADLGFFGSIQRKGQNSAPVFQVVPGGTTNNNGDRYGLAIGKVPAKRVPDTIRRLVELYDREKQDNETFADVVERVGKVRLKEEIADLAELPTMEENDDFYRDNRQTWVYHKSVGVGECAGEVVDQAEFMLNDADRLQFEATIALDEGRTQEAAQKAFQAQMKAADALLFTKGLLISDKYDTVAEFRKLFYDTGVFWKPFAENFFRSAEESADEASAAARSRVEEATLFIEAAQGVYSQA
ncbi:MAG: nitrite/sulfite reductase [Acidobacteria bacterium]|nr:nitrite/sulfite reductase [Acidobacteriota bacterium]MDA1234938.1 nitrite/sulfite reductase [Acidobacteriota bacterium]